MRMNTATRTSFLSRTSTAQLPLGLVALALVALGSIGCATETKVLQTSHFTLNYPDFWKVDKVAQKDGEATHVTIGRYSTGVINEGSGQSDIWEAQQADVDVRIYAWPEPAPSPDPMKKAIDLMAADSDLGLTKMAIISDDSHECGRTFKAKMNVVKSDIYPVEMMSKPGFRSIVVGATSDGVLVGVAARVPFEPDPGLYCHNLSNMRTQMQLLLNGLVVKGAATPAAAPPPPPPAP